MYILNNQTYADAGNYLKFGNNNSYVINSTSENILEISIDLDSMKIIENPIGRLAICNNGHITFIINYIDESDSVSYGLLKSSIIKIHYSNDDQLAIMLNRERSYDDRVKYNKMQEWREWASTVAKKILTMI